MTFQVIHSTGTGNARSPFRVIEQPIGREVDWINRFLDRECVRRLAETTLRSNAMDLLHFLRWWASVNHTDAITENALSASVLLDYLRFQAGHNPQPAAATTNRRVGVVERALRNEFPNAASPFVPGFHHFYWRRSPLGFGRPRPTLSRLRVKEAENRSPGSGGCVRLSAGGSPPPVPFPGSLPGRRLSPRTPQWSVRTHTQAAQLLARHRHHSWNHQAACPSPAQTLVRHRDGPGRRQCTRRDEATWTRESRDDHALSGCLAPRLTARVPSCSFPAPPSPACITAPCLDQFSSSHPHQSARFPPSRSARSGDVPPHSPPRIRS